MLWDWEGQKRITIIIIICNSFSKYIHWRSIGHHPRTKFRTVPEQKSVVLTLVTRQLTFYWCRSTVNSWAPTVPTHFSPTHVSLHRNCPKPMGEWDQRALQIHGRFAEECRRHELDSNLLCSGSDDMIFLCNRSRSEITLLFLWVCCLSLFEDRTYCALIRDSHSTH